MTDETQTVIYHGLVSIATGAFSECTALVEITLPVTVEIIEVNAFNNEFLVIKTSILEDEKPEGWADGWHGSSTVEWMAVETDTETDPDTESENEEKEDKLGWLS